MANPKIIAKKEKKVDELVEQLKGAELILLANFEGISVEQDIALRREVRDSGAEYRVIKNNIIRRAFEKAGIEGLDEELVGPTALIITKEDYLGPSKAIYKFAKDNKFYEIKAGIIEGNLKTSEEVIVLAQLPSREELIAKLAGVLQANIAKLAVALDAVRTKKETEEPVEEKAEVKTEEKVEEPKETAEEKTETKEEVVEEKEKVEETETVKEEVEEKPVEKAEEAKKDKKEETEEVKE